MTDHYPELALAIVKGQEEIIGPIAWEQAAGVNGLEVDKPASSIVIANNVDKKQVVENLILRFRDFFGQAAIEVCKDAAGKISQTMTKEELPESLK